jgi:hypothetical protein
MKKETIQAIYNAASFIFILSGILTWLFYKPVITYQKVMVYPKWNIIYNNDTTVISGVGEIGLIYPCGKAEIKVMRKDN